jgi:hypothetical protein
MTSQQQADKLLDLWRLQDRLGIPSSRRVLPTNDNQSEAEFERDLEVIRQCIERKS